MKKPVTLYDGTVVDNYSDAYRHECECRYLLSIPLEQRRKLMFGYTKPNGRKWPGIQGVRGEAAIERIKKTMTALHKHQKELESQTSNLVLPL